MKKIISIGKVISKEDQRSISGGDMGMGGSCFEVCSLACVNEYIAGCLAAGGSPIFCGDNAHNYCFNHCCSLCGCE